MKLRLFLLFAFCTISISISQNTVGLLQNSDEAYEGYTLFTPETSNSVYLIDNCGYLINNWIFDGEPNLTCYLLENGNILRTGSNGIEIRDWDNNLIWQYNLLTSLGLRQHHDIEPLPNGNFICLVKENISESEQIELGKNPALINGTFKSEKVIEFKPIGTDAIEIIWEWRFIDHLIQDFNEEKDNYGNVMQHPELVDFNYTDQDINHSDWLHMNSIDYNADLDQIMMSARTLNEIYIIDHSTTTEEAAGHTGGIQGKGGDFLWRWGNSKVYRQGTSANQKLFKQHDAKWITKNYVNENKISVFNNYGDNGQNTYSSIHIISPSLDENNTYLKENNAFLPSDYFWSWNGTVLGETVYQFNKCGVHALENGNMLICETNKGRLSEITPNGDVAWIYKNPAGTIIHNQFETDIEILGDNSMFRGEKYPKTYEAFIGRDLTPSAIIEDVNSLSESCYALSTNDLLYEDKLASFNNPIENNTLLFHQSLSNTAITIYSTNGQIVYEEKHFNGNKLKMSNLNAGIYFIALNMDGYRQIEKAIIK